MHTWVEREGEEVRSSWSAAVTKGTGLFGRIIEVVAVQMTAV